MTARLPLQREDAPRSRLDRVAELLADALARGTSSDRSATPEEDENVGHEEHACG